MTAIPSERELQALKILWQREEAGATVREVWESLTERGEQLAYTTVLSLMQVMEQKGLVGHRANGKVYSYFARIEREKTFQSLAKGFLETVFDGAMDEYVLHALGSQKLSSEELTRLEQMLAKARERSAGIQKPKRGNRGDAS